VSHFFAHYHHHSGELENVEILESSKGSSDKLKQLEEQKLHLTDSRSTDNSKEQQGREQMNVDCRSSTSSNSSDTEEQAGGSPVIGPRTKRKKLFAKLNRMLWGDGSNHPTWHKTLLLVFAITLHNFPEGLAVGVAFGAVGAAENKHRAFSNAVALAIGIGIQDFPEGLGVSMPLRRAGMSRMRSFLHGQFSGLVEPIGGIIGAAAVLVIQPILPFALSFAAGAMIFVVVEELIPESQRSGNRNIATLGTMVGFTLMMALDIALG
jgi:zinc transporter ZupT